MCLFSLFIFTKSGLNWVDNMGEAVRVECVSAIAAVIAWVNTQHGIVQCLWREHVS